MLKVQNSIFSEASAADIHSVTAVIPAKAGIHAERELHFSMDCATAHRRLRGNDGGAAGDIA
jgi:hypothetical protein